MIITYRYINNKKNLKYSSEIDHYNLKQLNETNNIFEDQIVYRKNVKEHKKTFKTVLDDINKNNHYILWFNKNIKINKSDNIIYILDINYDTKSFIYLNKYCNKMKINLYIISECHPNEFIDKILINNENIKININNYLSPYNFKYTFFGYLEKINNYSDNKLNIQVNDIVDYIKKNNTNYLLFTNNPELNLPNYVII